MLALPFADATFDAATVGFGVRNVADLERGAGASCGACSGRAAGSRSSRSRSRAASLKPFFSLWFDRIVPLLGKVLPGGSAYTYLPASVERFPVGRGARGDAARAGFGDVEFRLLAGTIVALHTGDGRVSALAPGERDSGARRLHGRGGDGPRARGRRAAGPRAGGRGRGAGRRRQAAAAAPLLPRPRRGEPSVPAGVAVEIVHMATLVHDDLVDGARMRRGAARGLVGVRRRRREGCRRLPLSRARSRVLADTGDAARGRDARRSCALPGARRGDAEAPDARPGRRRSTRTSSAARSRRGS